jgi:hypothetical protein
MSAVASVDSYELAPANHNNMTAEQMLMSGVNNGKFDTQRYNGFQFLMQGTTNKTKSKNHRSVALANVTKQQHKHRRSVNFNTSQSSQILKTWILLDNQSTVDVFDNDELLQNIRAGTG